MIFKIWLSSYALFVIPKGTVHLQIFFKNMLRTVTKHSTIIITKYTWYHRYREIIQITGGPQLRLYRKQDSKAGRRKPKCSEIDRRFPEQQTTESLGKWVPIPLVRGTEWNPTGKCGWTSLVHNLCKWPTKVYRPINNQDDHIRLQSDLEKLLMWADKWQLQFNASKRKVMHYGRRNKDFAYTMNPEDPADKMEVTTEEKYLGVMFSRDLKFSTHVAKAANKGNQVIGAIRRSFRYMEKDMFTQLYKALVRGHLEYVNKV